MPITWPKAVTVAVLKAEVDKLDARLAALEARQAEVDKAVADHWVLREELRQRRTAARLAELEDYAELNREALRVIFTVFQPGVSASTRAQADKIQETLALWVAKLGGRIPLD